MMAVRMRPTILLTGFGPFPGTPFNASAALVAVIESEAARRRLPYELCCATLPTDWREAPALVRTLADQRKPDAIIHFGVSSRATGFQIETLGFNNAAAALDCSGRLPEGHYVHRGGPPRLSATLPAWALLRQLRLAGLPVSLSADAGRYLCNATLYRSLLAAARSPALPLAGFIHIPALTREAFERASASPRECTGAMLEKGAWIILATLARIMRERKTPARRIPANRLMSSWL